MSDDATFLFADLAGFAALTEAHGDREAARLVGEFLAAGRKLLGPHGAQEIKTIGDALMVVVAEPDSAIRLGLRITRGVGSRHRMPSVRVGMHTGPAVERDGDYIGAAVNVAARVAAIARGDQVLLTGATAKGAGKIPDLQLRSLGERRLKNVRDPIDLYEAVWCPTCADRPGLPIDPVCRMAVDPALEIGTLTHEGRRFHFCSLECATAFAADPAAYAKDPPT